MSTYALRNTPSRQASAIRVPRTAMTRRSSAVASKVSRGSHSANVISKNYREPLDYETAMEFENAHFLKTLAEEKAKNANELKEDQRVARDDFAEYDPKDYEGLFDVINVDYSPEPAGVISDVKDIAVQFMKDKLDYFIAMVKSVGNMGYDFGTFIFMSFVGFFNTTVRQYLNTPMNIIMFAMIAIGIALALSAYNGGLIGLLGGRSGDVTKHSTVSLYADQKQDVKTTYCILAMCLH